MNRFYFLYVITINLSVYTIPLPIDINLNFGSGYNNNYFRFSDIEIENNFNALITLIEVQKTLNRSENTIKKLIDRAYYILPENKTIKALYRSISVDKKTRKVIKNNKLIKKNTINIDSKMATKTMYLLMIKQSKKDIAKKILETMIANKENIKFAQKELKNKQLSKLGK